LQVGIPHLRWCILRTLLYKEALRHLANRGGIALALLLIVAAMLLSFLGSADTPGEGIGGVSHCFVDYWEESPWIEHLRENVPGELKRQVKFRPAANAMTIGGKIVYPAGTGAIQIRTNGQGHSGPRYKVWLWHPGGDSAGLAPFEVWFWKESQRYFQARVAAASQRLGPEARAALQLPEIEEERSSLDGGLDPRSGAATALVLFGLFFICVYLLPSLTCEERERGVLLAQALSPASPLEILTAKFLFYPALGLALAGLLAGIYSPSALSRPFLWCSLGVAAAGSLGIGLTIASLARTQRAASMGALCYMLAVALLLFICQHNDIPWLSYLALEYHCPRIIHASLAGTVLWYHWGNLAGAAVLALVWAGSAVFLFRRWGWQ
jgi:hypothetical protein